VRWRAASTSRWHRDHPPLHTAHRRKRQWRCRILDHIPDNQSMGESKSPTATELEAQELEVFLRSVSRSVVGIVGKQNGEFGKGIGTGNLIQVAGAPHVLTAAHVIAGCSPDELRFIMPSPIQIQERSPGEKPCLRPTEIVPREPLHVKACRIDVKLDMAAIELSDIYLGFQNLSFREIVPAPPVPNTGDYLVMMGFPSEQKQAYGENYMVTRFVEYPMVVERGSRLLQDFDPATQFLLDYPASEDYDPAGFSGSGLWLRKEESGLWQPNPRMAGMFLGYYRGSKLLYAVSARAIAGLRCGSAS
jgi:hypothetical protein